MEVLEYIKDDGSSPYKKWFDSLNVQAAVKVTVAKARLELGMTSSIKWFDGIGEYRIDWGPGYRIYLLQNGKNLIVLFGGGTKK
jgi:putative addiction module killer protein